MSPRAPRAVGGAVPGTRPARPDAGAAGPEPEALARLLWDAERRRAPIEPLSATFPQLTLADAYRIQGAGRRLRTAAGARLRGWKVGLTSRAMQQMMGVEQPDAGYLLAETVVAGGARLPAGRFIQPRVEPEVAFLLGAPLEGAVTRAQVLAATEAFAPALEIIDSRIADWRIGIVDTVADNASCGMAVLGPWTAAGDVRPERLGVTLAVGPHVERGRGDAVLGHPAEPVAWLAGTLAAQGLRLEAGDVVLPGSVTRAIPIGPGQRAHATFDDIGEVTVSLA